MKTYRLGEFGVADLVARDRAISVVVPAKNEAAGIGLTVERLVRLRDLGAIDQVIVADDSDDETPHIALSLGAAVVRQADIRSELGPVIGKGDAMWRGLQAADGDVVCFVDADSADFGEHFITGLCGPLVAPFEQRRPLLVKGAYSRPFLIREEGITLPEGGGRVTEIMAKPLLNEFYPWLANLRQPLSGEIAADRRLLEALPFTCGWGVDVGLVIDAYRLHGAPAIAQSDLGSRQNDHKALSQLGGMATEVMRSVLSRAHPGVVATPETRPPAGA